MNELDAFIKNELGVKDSEPSSANGDTVSGKNCQDDFSLVCMSDVEAKPADFLISPYVRLHNLNLVRGDGSTGKTTLVMSVVAALTTNTQPDAMPGVMNIDTPQTVVYLCGEDELETYAALLKAQGADTDRVFMPRRNVPTLAQLDVIGSMIQGVGADILVIDPIAQFLPQQLDMNRSNHIRPVMEQLRDICRRHHCTTIMVEHLNKQQKTDNVYRGSGSMDIFNASRSVLITGYDRDGNSVCGHLKSNGAAPGPAIRFEIVSTDNGAPRLNWLGADEEIDGANVCPSKPRFSKRRKAIESRTANYMQLLSALVGETFWEGRTAEAIERAKALGITGDFTAEGLGRFLATTKLKGIRIASRRHTSSGTRYRLERDSDDR